MILYRNDPKRMERKSLERKETMCWTKRNKDQHHIEFSLGIVIILLAMKQDKSSFVEELLLRLSNDWPVLYSSLSFLFLQNSQLWHLRLTLYYEIDLSAKKEFLLKILNRTVDALF